MDHSVPAAMAGGAGGALYVGPGWDGGLLGLALYINGEISEDHDPQAMANSPEVVEFTKESVRAWIKAVRESALATEEELRAAAEASIAQFAPGSTFEELS